MRLIHCKCGSGPSLLNAASTFNLPALPSRTDLRFLDELAAQLLPVDTTASLDEIQASASVSHLGEPQRAPQTPLESLRVIVSGTDAALSAVLTRMMRGDYLWAEVVYVPADPTSPAALLWGAPSQRPTIDELAETPVTPSPCIRNDFGEVVAGSATVSHAKPTLEFIGEVVVDSSVLLLRSGDEPSARFFGTFGAKLVPTASAPGIAATTLVTPLSTPPTTTGRLSRRSPADLERLVSVPGGKWLTRGTRVPAALTGSSVLTGRALQCGGEEIQVVVDAVARKRAVEKVTFYRHLRDVQSVKFEQS